MKKIMTSFMAILSVFTIFSIGVLAADTKASSASADLEYQISDDYSKIRYISTLSNVSSVEDISSVKITLELSNGTTSKTINKNLSTLYSSVTGVKEEASNTWYMVYTLSDILDYEEYYLFANVTYTFNDSSILNTETVEYVIDDNSEINITECNPYSEGAYLEFSLKSGFSNSSDYTAYYKSNSKTAWTKVDDELIRIDGSTGRVDILGLEKGYYDFKIALASDNTISTAKSRYYITPYDRSGYAHFNYTAGVGAYNDDGSLKDNAQVVYVTEETKNTVTATINGSSYTGICAILKAQKSASNPLDVRLIGTIGAATWSKSTPDVAKYTKGSQTTTTIQGINGEYLALQAYTESEILSSGLNEFDESTYSKLTGLTNKITYSSSSGWDSYYNMLDLDGLSNVTIEGVGEDAKIEQWGFTFKRCSYIEVRNLTFSNNPEDACSFENSSEQTITTIDGFTTGHIWVHNNTFNRGYNVWDVCYEQDKGDGDGATDFKGLAYVTVSYNHYYNNHKTGLVGSSSTSYTACLSFHHNFYDTNESRLPYARRANMHMYNNYYYGSTNNNMQIYDGAYAFIENCVFENCTSKTFTISSTNALAAIKLYNSTITNCKNYDGATTVTDRTATVSNENSFGQTFDTDSSIFYYDSDNKCSKVDNLLSTDDVKEFVEKYAGAGKLYRLPCYLNDAATALEEEATSGDDTQGDTQSDYIKIFDSGISDSFFTISGNLKSGIASKTYDGTTYTTALKIESSTSITFTLTSSAKLIIISDTASSSIYVSGTLYTADSDGVFTINLAAGSYNITKKTQINVYSLIIKY